MAAVSAEDDCSNTTTGADVTSSILTKDSANSNTRIELDEEEEPSSTCIEEIHGDDDVFLTPSESPFPPESVNTVIQSPLDPLAESYRVSTYTNYLRTTPKPVTRVGARVCTKRERFFQGQLLPAPLLCPTLDSKNLKILQKRAYLHQESNLVQLHNR